MNWSDAGSLALTYGGIIVTLLVALVLLSGSIFTVSTNTAAIVERFSKFHRVARPGLQFKFPFVDSVVDHVDLAVKIYNMKMETKTKDNVFVTIFISLQYTISPDKVYDAFYRITKIGDQMASYVEQVVLGHVPTMELDETFAKQSEIAAAVRAELTPELAQYGYTLLKAMVTDVVPAENVKEAMNNINAALREQAAATAKGEAAKIMVIKNAEARAEEKRLQGEGVAAERLAIIEGLEKSIKEFKAGVEGSSSQDVMALVVMTQFFDALRDIGQHSNTILMPYTPGAVGDIMSQIRNGIISGNLATGTHNLETKDEARS